MDVRPSCEILYSKPPPPNALAFHPCVLTPSSIRCYVRSWARSSAPHPAVTSPMGQTCHSHANHAPCQRRSCTHRTSETMTSVSTLLLSSFSAGSDHGIGASRGKEAGSLSAMRRCSQVWLSRSQLLLFLSSDLLSLREVALSWRRLYGRHRFPDFFVGVKVEEGSNSNLLVHVPYPSALPGSRVKIPPSAYQRTIGPRPVRSESQLGPRLYRPKRHEGATHFNQCPVRPVLISLPSWLTLTQTTSSTRL